MLLTLLRAAAMSLLGAIPQAPTGVQLVVEHLADRGGGAALAATPGRGHAGFIEVLGLWGGACASLPPSTIPPSFTRASLTLASPNQGRVQVPPKPTPSPPRPDLVEARRGGRRGGFGAR
jgi:hypothetical protein